MFCFPNTGHVIILHGTVSFKFRVIQVHMYMYVCIVYETTKGQIALGPLLGKQNIQAIKRLIDTA